MNKMKIYISLILFFSLIGGLMAQSIRYHKIQFSSSDLKLIEWNIKDTTNGGFVIEYIDKKERTKELRFYNWNHKLDWPGSGFFGGPIIRYDYTDSTIIETYFTSDNNIANDFQDSEAEYRVIYYIYNNEIVKTEHIYKIDFQYSEESLKETIKHLQFYYNLLVSEKSNQKKNKPIIVDEILGYKYAQAKFNGKNPKHKIKK